MYLEELFGLKGKTAVVTGGGQGIGQAIYKEILRYAKMRKASQVTLNVWCCNENAMKFYEKLGLKPQKIGMEIQLDK